MLTTCKGPTADRLECDDGDDGAESGHDIHTQSSLCSLTCKCDLREAESGQMDGRTYLINSIYNKALLCHTVDL